MRALVVYESMFGNTHEVAERVGEGVGHWCCHVLVAPVGETTGDMVAEADLLVVGGPTHVHGMSRWTSRKSAREQAAKDPDLELDPDAEGPGVREWFAALAEGGGRSAAAFDTRFDASPVLTGRASRGIAKRLDRHGFRLVAEPESFLVDQENRLVAGEPDRAKQWGEQLARAFSLAE